MNEIPGKPFTAHRIPLEADISLGLFTQKRIVILKNQIMADISPKDKLINKIKETDDPAILEEFPLFAGVFQPNKK